MLAHLYTDCILTVVAALAVQHNFKCRLKTNTRMGKHTAQNVAWTIKEAAKNGVTRMVYIAGERLYHLHRTFLQSCEVINADGQRSLPKENTTMTEKQHNNGKLFFGRIQILYENNTPEATPTANSLDNDVKKIFILHITRGTPAGSCCPCIF